jgi:zinc D-Ala-D-Ala dipeptidase
MTAPAAEGAAMTPPPIAIDALASDAAFRSLRRLTPPVAIDLRYASTRNLLGRDVYAPHDCAWLHADAAAALEQAAALLARERPAWRLLVLDAARPQRVQEQFWAHVVGTPMERYFAPPERGSIHSFGMAVDLTLADGDGREVDMGTPFDDTTELSHPPLEDQHVRSGRLRPGQVAHRRLLRAVMQGAGWQAINTEWWHFDFGDRARVRASYRRIV